MLGGISGAGRNRCYRYRTVTQPRRKATCHADIDNRAVRVTCTARTNRKRCPAPARPKRAAHKKNRHISCCYAVERPDHRLTRIETPELAPVHWRCRVSFRHFDSALTRRKPGKVRRARRYNIGRGQNFRSALGDGRMVSLPARDKVSRVDSRERRSG